MQGERLGPYQIERELGAGGMGKVYAATVAERAPGRTVGERVALKIVHPHLLEAEGFFKRFLREAQLGQSIHHENVVLTLDCDAVGGHHFLVMEYVEGQTLAGLQSELDKVPEELCRHVARRRTGQAMTPTEPSPSRASLNRRARRSGPRPAHDFGRIESEGGRRVHLHRP